MVISTKVLYKECLVWYNLTSTGAQAPGISHNSCFSAIFPYGKCADFSLRTPPKQLDFSAVKYVF
jgi:hypothetical protein